MINHQFTVGRFGFDFMYNQTEYSGVAKPVRETYCNVTNLDTEEIVIQAKVGCNSNDRFEKSIGRKKVLARALTAPSFAELYGKNLAEFKLRVWDEYFKSLKK
jgi:hypothetical protein